MSGWDDTPAPAADGGFTADGGFEADNNFGNGDNYTGGDFSEANISRHANGDAGADGDTGCRICKSESHFARDCPDKKENTGECYNCGEMGHNKADCPNPAVEREFTGTCNFCGQSGHRAKDCAERPPAQCRICKEEGHIASECSANRMFAAFKDMAIKEMPVEDAWKMIEEADKDKDVDDIKKAILTYAKAYPEVTFEELEQVFRDAEMNTYIIAKKQEIPDTYTIVNLQGKQDQEFVVSIQFTNKPRRAKFAEGWPKDAEDNKARLETAGLPMDRMVPKCSNCNQMGHGSKQCSEEKAERASTAIMCANCSNEGHYARDCAEPRKTGKKGCRNCGDESHIAKECPEPRNPDNVTCRNCDQVGHFSKDCPSREPDLCRNCGQEGHRAKECGEPKNMANMQCRNCDEMGHGSRECPKPTDWSRVECSECHEKGHSYKRCKAPAADAADEGGDGGW